MDRLATFFFVSLALTLSLAWAGTTSTVRFESTSLARVWTYNAYLPDDYQTSNLEYPVIYLLHGSGGDESSWNEGISVLDALIEKRVIPPVIAIAPASGSSWWVDSDEPFETAFLEDLVPHIDATYRTIDNREGRAIAGFSMGGYGALRYALAHPEVFGAAAILSPSLYDQQPPPGSSARTSGAFGSPFDPHLWTQRNYPALLASYQRSFDVPLFIAAGDDDWNEPAGWQYNVEYQAVLLFERLSKEGGTPAELRIVDGGHDWDLWKPLLSEAFPYMLGYLRLPGPNE